MTEPIARIKQGQLKGVTDIDLDGEPFLKFLGIPYAEPPVGNLRFKAPQPAKSWTDVRDASKEGNWCHQNMPLPPGLVGSEDCLYLNVYTKQLPKEGVSLKPVIVFIHGGAFTMGSGSEMLQGPKHLICEDIVLVAINYRLGIFGFLSSDDLSLEVPGNAALKDQTLALKWVKENISSFNGDPGNITIYGISAGAASVHFQVLSPSSKGLFHKAIASSGAALCPWAWGQKNMILVAEKLGQKVSSDKEALEIIKKATPEDLSKISKILMEQHNITKRQPFGPVIEEPNPTEFLTEDPIELMSSGRYNHVPIIQGVTSNEGLISEYPNFTLSSKLRIEELGVFWALGLEKGTPKYEKVKQMLREFYCGDSETTDAIHKVVGDVAFLTSTIESVKLEAETSRCPVYLYVFSYELAIKFIFSLFQIDGNQFKGVSHGEDLYYAFNMARGLAGLDPKVAEEAKTAIKKLTKLWANFARTGQPHPNWEPVTNEKQLKYFDINADPQLKVNPFSERVKLWEAILKETNGMHIRLQEKPTV